MPEHFMIAARGILGVRTNARGFSWSFGMRMPAATQAEYEACEIRLRLEVGAVPGLGNGQPVGKYHYFQGAPEADVVYYERPFLFNAKLLMRAEGLLSAEPCVRVNRAYYRLVAHRFMNLHSIHYILTDLAALLLLRRGYAPLHCSAFRKGDATAVIFAPPNTGKTLTAVMACLEHGAQFLAEDIAITDGTMIYPVPWTSTFRYYARLEPSLRSRAASAVRRMLPALELLPLAKPKPITAYLDGQGIFQDSEITHLFILERGPTAVRPASPQEAWRKLVNLNRFEFCYHKAPLIVAHEFFNPALNIDAACKAERDLLQAVADRARVRMVVQTDDATKYASLVTEVME